MTQPTSEALSDDPFPDSPVFEKVEEDHGATPTYMIVVRESWRESILCEGMYGWAADWLVKQLNDLEGVRKDRLVGLSQAVTSRTFAAMQESLDQALARCEAAEAHVQSLVDLLDQFYDYEPEKHVPNNDGTLCRWDAARWPCKQEQIRTSPAHPASAAQPEPGTGGV